MILSTLSGIFSRENVCTEVSNPSNKISSTFFWLIVFIASSCLQFSFHHPHFFFPSSSIFWSLLLLVFLAVGEMVDFFWTVQLSLLYYCPLLPSPCTQPPNASWVLLAKNCYISCPLPSSLQDSWVLGWGHYCDTCLQSPLLKVHTQFVCTRLWILFFLLVSNFDCVLSLFRGFSWGQGHVFLVLRKNKIWKLVSQIESLPI